MKLRDLIADYSRDNDISEGYEYQLGYAVKRMEKWLEREPVTDDLDQRKVNEWLQFEQRSGKLSARSRANLRTSVQTLWKAAAELNVAGDVGKIRPVKLPDTNPEAWTFDQLRAVASAAEELEGHIPNGIPRSWYFPTLIWYGFEAGLRRSDCFGFDVRDLRGTNGAHVQHKTGRTHGYRITDETAESLLRIADQLKRSGNPRWMHPLDYPGSVSQVYYWLRRCRLIAGVDADVPNRSLQHLRRTGATQVEIESPMTAWKYLGHSTGPTLSRKHYIDKRLASRPVMPGMNRSCQTSIERENESDAC